MTILDLLRENQIEPKKAAGTQDEYSSPCPECGGNDRFRCWPKKDRWWCRGCEKKGDSIQYLREFRAMSYFDACKHLDRKPEFSSSAGDTRPSRPKWEPKQPREPAALWRDQAVKLLEHSINKLWSDAGKDALEWLKTERGFTEETIETFHLGWNPKDLWRDRAHWGLPEVLKENGDPKKLWIPAGLVIPMGKPGELSKIKIRRPDPGEGPRYYLLPGSSMQAMTFGTEEPVLIVVESELDALLIHQEAGSQAGAIALGSSSTRPDSITTDILKRASLILVALDSDGAGAKESWQWWRENFPEARRWPPIGGKDPGEMRKAGVSVSAWIEAGIEEYSARTESQSSAADPSRTTTQAELFRLYEIIGTTYTAADWEALTTLPGWSTQLDVLESDFTTSWQAGADPRKEFEALREHWLKGLEQIHKPMAGVSA